MSRILACLAIVGVLISALPAQGQFKNLKKYDPTKGARKLDPLSKNSDFRRELRNVDPTAAARQELERARRSAMRNLPRFHPDEITMQVQRALHNRIVDQLNRSGVTYDEQSGTFDLRRSRMGESLQHWLRSFAQGNKSEGSVRELSYNVNTRQLVVKLYARHCQTWNRSVSLLGQQHLYEVRQTADLRYDFRRGEGSFDIDLGRLGPRFQSKSFVKLSEGDLIGAVEAAVPRGAGEIIGVERVNHYDTRVKQYYDRYGRENVYFASRRFVDWASPDTLRRHGITAIITSGTSVGATMEKVKQESLKELEALGAWIQQKGWNFADARRIGTDLLSGRGVQSPYVKLELVPVRYSAREARLGTPWRHEDHLGFVVVWQNPSNATATGNVASDIPSEVTPRPFDPRSLDRRLFRRIAR